MQDNVLNGLSDRTSVNTLNHCYNFLDWMEADVFIDKPNALRTRGVPWRKDA